MRTHPRRTIPRQRPLFTTVCQTARFGHAHRAADGASRTCNLRQTRRRQNRPATPRHTLCRHTKIGRRPDIQQPKTGLRTRRTQTERHLHATRRSIGNRHRQHRDGCRRSRRHHHHLQRRLRTLLATTMQTAQQDGSQNFGRRVEPVDHRRRENTARHHAPHFTRHD